MEKLKSTFRNMSLVLITVTVITGALLAVVNHVTEEPIKVQADKVLSDGIKTVMRNNNIVVDSADSIVIDNDGRQELFVVYRITGDGAGDVIVEIFQWFFDGFADRFETGKMDNRFDIVFLQDLVHSLIISNVTLFKTNRFAEYLFQPFKHGSVTVAEVVIDHHIMTAFNHFNSGMRADKSRATGKQNTHLRFPKKVLNNGNNTASNHFAL